MTITAKTFDSYAAGYVDKFNRNPLGKYQRERVQTELAPYLQPGIALLDVGCGPGSDFAFYRSKHLAIDAMDISEKMVELARQAAAKLGLTATVSHCDLLDFWTGKSYDVIVLNFGVINAMADPDAALEKLQHLLKPDGILAIVAMPPFHLFTVLGDFFSLRLRTVYRRIVLKKLSLANGMTVRYFAKNTFLRQFKLIKKINLCAVLPTPDQYQQSVFARWIAKMLLPIDRTIAEKIPDAFGGDHVCYLLRKGRNG